MGHNIGDIVEVNGKMRIVTMVGNGLFQSEPYEKDTPEVEVIDVPKPEKKTTKTTTGKGKKK